jgi:hypothetical protein
MVRPLLRFGRSCWLLIKAMIYTIWFSWDVTVPPSRRHSLDDVTPISSRVVINPAASPLNYLPTSPSAVRAHTFAIAIVNQTENWIQIIPSDGSGALAARVRTTAAYRSTKEFCFIAQLRSSFSTRLDSEFLTPCLATAFRKKQNNYLGFNKEGLKGCARPLWHLPMGSPCAN